MEQQQQFMLLWPRAIHYQELQHPLVMLLSHICRDKVEMCTFFFYFKGIYMIKGFLNKSISACMPLVHWTWSWKRTWEHAVFPGRRKEISILLGNGGTASSISEHLLNEYWLIFKMFLLLVGGWPTWHYTNKCLKRPGRKIVLNIKPLTARSEDLLRSLQVNHRQ